ncbi:MAG TPA: dihydrolipoamide acetyltransferase family protein [Polyangiaceae bacterium]|nr:dihydrolipoamide acetyltransferase family protein [Polyangiaceae bacterium]
MARFEFKLPDIGEGVAEGEIVSWLVKEGDTVGQDQDMVEVMTDKATVTIGAPRPGTVVELRAKAGDVVPVGDVLVVFDSEGGEAGAGAKPEEGAKPEPAKAPEQASQATETGRARQVAQQEGEGEGPAATAVGDLRESLPGMSPAAPAGAGSNGSYYNEKPLAAPATRKLARELGVDLKRVKPSGAHGRVMREDVEAFGRGAPEGAAGAAQPAAGRAPAVPDAPPVASRPDDERVPIRGLRKRIFENMARSKRTAAHFAYADECDVTALKELRERLKPHGERAGVKLTFLPFIVKAVVSALKKHPMVNSVIDEAAQEIVLRKTYDLGIATATDAGLIVPVLRQADRLSLVEIAREIERIAADARKGQSKREDLGGSSFTITSLGKLGGLFSTPVVNHPEVAILGIHEMKRRPVVKGDQIAIADVTVLALSFDHRIIDGHVGAAFTQEIIALLQEPERLLVE